MGRWDGELFKEYRVSIGKINSLEMNGEMVAQ